MDIYWRLEERTWPNLAKSPRSEALILSDGSAAMVPLFHQNMSYNIFFSFDLCKLMVIRHVWTILWTIIRFIWIITKSYSIWPDYAQNIRILCRQRRAQGRYILSRWIKISNFKFQNELRSAAAQLSSISFQLWTRHRRISFAINVTTETWNQPIFFSLGIYITWSKNQKRVSLSKFPDLAPEPLSTQVEMCFWLIGQNSQLNKDFTVAILQQWSLQVEGWATGIFANVPYRERSCSRLLLWYQTIPRQPNASASTTEFTATNSHGKEIFEPVRRRLSLFVPLRKKFRPFSSKFARGVFGMGSENRALTNLALTPL